MDLFHPAIYLATALVRRCGDSEIPPCSGTRVPLSQLLTYCLWASSYGGVLRMTRTARFVVICTITLWLRRVHGAPRHKVCEQRG